MLFSLVSFLGAFLLFALQPFASKTITPWFGGGSHVWLTCMVFSQAMLLAGYGYTHWLVSKLEPRRQVVVHIAVMALALLSLGLAWHASGNPCFPVRKIASDPSPFRGVLVVMVKTFGLPFFVLSATSPIVQTWFHNRHREAVPYRLYSFSNAGSLGGLVAYPFLAEPFSGLRLQGWVLAALFLAYILGLGWIGLGVRGELGPAERAPRPHFKGAGAWLFLSFSSTLFMMAVSNILCSELMGIPLLWVAPLVLYLLTFILAFDGHLQAKGLGFQFLLYAILCLSLLSFPWTLGLPDPRWLIASMLTALLAGCLLCHGLLYELRPPAQGLTAYYLIISAGGVLGGLAVAWVAPHLFNRFYEWPLASVLLAGVCGLAWYGDQRRWRHVLWVPVLGLSSVGLVQILHEAGIPGKSYRDIFGMVQVGKISGGSLKILLHGRTLHGLELMNDPLAKVAYYKSESGIGRTLEVARMRWPVLNIGLVGLGVGNVLGYAQPGDSATVYEISPKIVTLAGPEAAEFTVLKSSPAKSTVRLGDGRFLIEREPSTQQFDVLLVDAFSGGNIPWHLITCEAFMTYFQHVQSGGYVVVNATNHLAIDRLVLANAGVLGLCAAVIECPGPGNRVTLGPYGRYSVFVVLCRKWEDLSYPQLVQPARALLVPGSNPFPVGSNLDEELVRRLKRGSAESSSARPWTDDQSSLSRLLFAR